MSNSKTVVITGASSGIGFGLAKAFLASGFNVVGNARSAGRLAEGKAQLDSPAFIGVAGDIAKPETARRLIQASIDAFGQVDVLVNNAGFFLPKPFIEYSPEDIQGMLETNLKGVVYASQAAAAHMIERRQGHIINITAAVALQSNIAVPAALPVLIKGASTRSPAPWRWSCRRTTSRLTRWLPASSRRRCTIRPASTSSTVCNRPDTSAASATLPTPCFTWPTPGSPRAWCCRSTAV